MNRFKIAHYGTILFFASTTALFVILLFIAQYPIWWKWIIFERTPMTWLESILLFSSFFTLLLLTLHSFVANEEIGATIRYLSLSVAFGYLTLDERFAIHERIRDSLLAPRNIALPGAHWIAPGDFILIILMVMGIASLHFFMPLFKERRDARHLFLLGVVCASIAVLFDSWDVHALSIDFQRLQQFIEEILETIAMLLFFASFWSLYISKIKCYYRKLN